MSTDLSLVYQGLADSDNAAVSVILKLRGETCDIDCLYCYEKRKETPDTRSFKPDLVKGLVETFRGREIALELHGGEPLTIGREKMGALLRQIASHSSITRLSMQTNGVLLDERWVELFEATYPSINFGISLDGDELGNSWRVDYNGEPTYQRSVDALTLLGRRGHRVGIIVTVTPLVLGRAAAVLQNLSSFSAVNSISLVPCFDQQVVRATAFRRESAPASRIMQAQHIADRGQPSWAISPQQYAEFVLDAAAFWCQSGLHSSVKLEPIVSTIRKLKGLSTGFCHFSSLKCDHIFTLYPDGRLGSCDELSWPAAELSRINELKSEADVRSAQGGCSPLKHARDLMRKCLTCSYRPSCGGGCIATRIRYAAAGDEEAYCHYRMRLVDGVAALLAAPDSTAGLHCKRLRWKPRTPNAIGNISTFIESWNDPSAVRRSPRLLRSDAGNINTVGKPGVHEADDVDPLSPWWSQAIEPGVLPIVDAITSTWGCITYDSCEGHWYAEGEGPTARRVGLLPRSRGEYAALALALCRVMAAAGPLLPDGVVVAVGRSNLTCKDTGRDVPVLDLSLEPVEEGAWSEYFRQLDGATAELVAAFAKVTPQPRADCACVGHSERSC